MILYFFYIFFVFCFMFEKKLNFSIISSPQKMKCKARRLLKKTKKLQNRKIKNLTSSSAFEAFGFNSFEDENERKSNENSNSIDIYNNHTMRAHVREESEFDSLDEFRKLAELIIQKQEQSIKICRLRIGNIYVLVNFTKGESSRKIAIPKVMDLKLKIKQKIYIAKSDAKPLDMRNILQKHFLKTILKQLPSTFIKHTFGHSVKNNANVNGQKIKDELLGDQK